MSKLFFIGVGLTFIFEGLIPFLTPHVWRKIMQHMFLQDDKTLRLFGLISMLIGLILIYIFR